VERKLHVSRVFAGGPRAGGHGHDANGGDMRVGIFWILRWGRWSVVCGDIGTSPLYAVAGRLASSSKAAWTVESRVGVVSLIIWALLIVVTANTSCS